MSHIDTEFLEVSVCPSLLLLLLLISHKWGFTSLQSISFTSLWHNAATSSSNLLHIYIVKDAEWIRNVTSPRTGSNPCKCELCKRYLHMINETRTFFYRIISSSIQHIISPDRYDISLNISRRRDGEGEW